MTRNDPRPLVPYLRQRRAKERTISIDEQRRDIERWANEAGVTLAPELVEQNVSGSKPWRERALGEAVAACERGEAAGIIVAWQDRLSRENNRASGHRGRTRASRLPEREGQAPRDRQTQCRQGSGNGSDAARW
jgi:Resolvase, N terminal domain